MSSEHGLPAMVVRVQAHPAFQKLKELFGPIARSPIWWGVEHSTPETLDYREACKTCHFVRAGHHQRAMCQKDFLKAIGQARVNHRPQGFTCPIARPAFVIPLLQENHVTGYLAACHAEGPLPEAFVSTAALLVGALVRELEKDQELANLYESVQPRCVALSTIHTIHRLISTTVDPKELLPRLARLCAQVMRVSWCSIVLVDEGRRRLMPAALVGGGARYQKPIRIGQGIPGRVAATARAYLHRRILAVPLIDQDCIGVITVQNKQQGRPFSAFDQEILTTLAEQAVIAINSARLYHQQEKVALGTIKSLSAILGVLDGHTPRHGQKHARFLAEVALAIADEMGVRMEDRRCIQYAALLHDTGRSVIPDEILLKQTPLTGKELQIVRRHPLKGVQLMRPLEILEPAVPIILHHHERFGGRGYPKGLKGEAIPLGARILAVANAFEAMICERPYREALSMRESAREIRKNAGTQFDPRVVETFYRIARRGVFRHLARRM